VSSCYCGHWSRCTRTSPSSLLPVRHHWVYRLQLRDCTTTSTARRVYYQYDKPSLQHRRVYYQYDTTESTDCSSVTVLPPIQHHWVYYQYDTPSLQHRRVYYQYDTTESTDCSSVTVLPPVQHCRVYYQYDTPSLQHYYCNVNKVIL